MKYRMDYGFCAVGGNGRGKRYMYATIALEETLHTLDVFLWLDVEN